MIVNEEYLRKLIRESILNIIDEDFNPAFDRSNRTKSENLGRIWDEIDRKQEELYNMVFGELSEKLYDITKAKADAMVKNDKDNGHNTTTSNYLKVPFSVVSAGNEKLPSSVLIANMSSSLMCPSYYLGICTIRNSACYAQRAENQYSGREEDTKAKVLQNRWQTDLMHTQMLQQYQHGNKEPMKKYFNLVETYIQLGNAYSANIYKQEIKRLERLKKRKLTKEEKDIIILSCSEHRISDIRLNETGDFHCQLAVKLWNAFARKMKKKYGIGTHAYTARQLDFSDAAKNIAINPSHGNINLGDTKPRYFKAVSDEEYDRLAEVELNENYQPILDKRSPEGKLYYKCPCGDKESKCNLCGVCFHPNETGKEYTIYVRYHGVKNARGFKNIFTKNEISSVMNALENNGWFSEPEKETYHTTNNQKRLDKISNVTQRMRQSGRKK